MNDNELNQRLTRLLAAFDAKDRLLMDEIFDIKLKLSGLTQEKN